jgi:hypothetical protein
MQHSKIVLTIGKYDNIPKSRGPLMVAQWLRYCCTNRKVAGSIPDSVLGIFHCHNPSDRIMALGSTQPLNRNEYQEHLLGVKAASA